MDSEQSKFTTDFRKFVSLIDRLQDTGYNKHMSFPRVAVLGSYGVGKSSIIEQIVGFDFIPKGYGIITRRPLQIRIVYVSKEKLSTPYGVFEEIPGQTFSDFKQIERNIHKLTDKVCGSRKIIQDMPIVLTIFQTTCPDILIFDLPGIHREQVQQDSTAMIDYVRVTKDIIVRYCSDPNTIILCILPANLDISDSYSLKMARYLDPQGIRTIRVLTKMDIMDRGADARSLLLESGFIGVKNRSNNHERQTIQYAIEEEQKYFSTNPVYSNLPTSLLGTKSLTNKIIDVFKAQYRTFIPVIVSEIQNQINKKEDKLKELGQGMTEENTDKMKTLWKIIDDFSLRFKNSINCSYNSLSTSENNILPESHRIRQIFNNLYKETKQTKPTDIYPDIEIKNAVERPVNFDFHLIDPVIYLFTPLLENLKKPAFECINEIYHILKELAVNILTKTVKTAPDLKDELQELILNHLKNERDSCRKKIENLFDSEYYFFTNDIEYLISRSPPINRQGFSPNDPTNIPESHSLKQEVDDYFLLVKRGICNSVPKMIGCFLVKSSQVIFISFHLQNISYENYFKQHKLQSVFLEAINQNSKQIDLVVETNSHVQERKVISNEIQALKAQTEMLRRDFDFSILLEKYVKLSAIKKYFNINELKIFLLYFYYKINMFQYKQDQKDEREKALNNSVKIREQLFQNSATNISNTNQNEHLSRNINNTFSQTNEGQINKTLQDTKLQIKQQPNEPKCSGFKFW